MTKAAPFARQRPLAAGVLLFAIGIWAGAQGVLPWYVFAAALLLTVLFAGVMGKRHSVLCAVLTAVFFAGGLYTSALAHLPRMPEGDYTVTAYVHGDAEIRETDGYIHTYLRRVVCEDEMGNVFRAPKMYWGMYAAQEEMGLCRFLEDGAKVHFQGKVTVPSGRENPHGFDYAMYLKGRGVFLRAGGLEDLRITLDGDKSFTHLVYRLRNRLSSHLDEIFGEYAAVPQALLLGEKNQLPDETGRLFSDLGIAHILSVSGLHVALLASLWLYVLRPLHFSHKARSCMLMLALLLYCTMLDFAAPVVRASLLLTGNECRKLTKRQGDPLTLLMAVMGVILVATPYSLFSVSFQMTFGAMMGMVLLSAPIRKRMQRMPAMIRFLRLELTLPATIGILLPLVNCFHRFSLLGLIVSPLAVAALSVLLPLIAALMLLGAVWMPLAQTVSAMLGKIFFFVPAVMEWAADLPFNVINIPTIPFLPALALVTAVFLCSRYTGLEGKRRGAAIAVVLALGVGAWQLTEVYDVCYIQLSMGQADSAVITDGRKTVVLDAGENGSDLASYLLAEGRKADTLIITHLHNDHAGGVRALLEKDVPIGRVLIPSGATLQEIDPETETLLEMLKERQIPVLEVKAGDTVELPRGKITFVWPLRVRSGQDANWYSLSTLMDLDGVRILSMADVPGIFEQYAAHRADILKVSHHGSNEGTYEAFLHAVQPETALITCSRGRLLPGEDTLCRLKDAGVRVMRTDETGAVTVRIRNGSYSVKPYLK